MLRDFCLTLSGNGAAVIVVVAAIREALTVSVNVRAHILCNLNILGAERSDIRDCVSLVFPA